MLTPIRLLALALILNASASHAVTVDVTDGVIGSLSTDQRFDGTEAVDLELIAPVDFSVTSIKLREFTLGASASGTIGARFYDSQTRSLLASQDAPVNSGPSQSIVIPISATLRAGHTYRIGFFLDYGSASGIDTDPPGPPMTPFMERTGLFQIAAVFRSNVDGFPSEPYPYLPFMSLEVVQAAPVPEPNLLAILGVGSLMLALLVGRRMR